MFFCRLSKITITSKTIYNAKKWDVRKEKNVNSCNKFHFERIFPTRITCQRNQTQHGQVCRYNSNAFVSFSVAGAFYYYYYYEMLRGLLVCLPDETFKVERRLCGVRVLTQLFHLDLSFFFPIE